MDGASGGDGEDGDLGARLLAGLTKVRNGKGEVTLDFVACVAKPVYGLMVARTIGPSIKAKCSPMHTRGPAPNGRYDPFGRAASRSGSQRSGSKRVGSGKLLGRKCCA